MYYVLFKNTKQVSAQRKLDTLCTQKHFLRMHLVNRLNLCWNEMEHLLVYVYFSVSTFYTASTTTNKIVFRSHILSCKYTAGFLSIHSIKFIVSYVCIYLWRTNYRPPVRFPLQTHNPLNVNRCLKKTNTWVMHPIPSRAFAQPGSKAKAALSLSKACWVCPAFR